jgi:hypothetical protein
MKFWLTLFIPSPINIAWDFPRPRPSLGLLLVCKNCRALVLGTPELRSDIYVDYPHGFYWGDAASSPRRLTKIAHKTLLRSQNTLLALRIQYNMSNTANIGPLIDLIVLHAHRLRSPTLNVSDKALEVMFAKMSILFGSLEFLSLNSYNYKWEASLPLMFFQNVPRLHQFSLYLILVWHSWAPDSPWEQLTSLSPQSGDRLSPSVAHNFMMVPEPKTSSMLHSSKTTNQEGQGSACLEYLFHT